MFFSLETRRLRWSVTGDFQTAGFWWYCHQPMPTQEVGPAGRRSSPWPSRRRHPLCSRRMAAPQGCFGRSSMLRRWLRPFFQRDVGAAFPAEVGLDEALLEGIVANAGGDGVTVGDRLLREIVGRGRTDQSWGEVAPTNRGARSHPPIVGRGRTHQSWGVGCQAPAQHPAAPRRPEGKTSERRCDPRQRGLDARAQGRRDELSPARQPDARLRNRRRTRASSGDHNFAIQGWPRSLEKILGQPLAEALAARFGARHFEDGAFFGHRNNLGGVANPRDLSGATTATGAATRSLRKIFFSPKFARRCPRTCRAQPRRARSPGTILRLAASASAPTRRPTAPVRMG